jgi:hypothetical protein
MNITFIGNCQTVSLCFYFQQLLFNCNNIQWVLYGDEFKMHLNEWSHKTENKIINYDISIDVIKKSDVIIYQEISKEKSLFSNTETLQSIKKESCRLIKIPSIYFDYSNYDSSMKELKKREIINKVDISVSDILEKYKERKLMITIDHPNTFLFLEIVNELCRILNINTFTTFMRDLFLENNNYMGLPI